MSTINSTVSASMGYSSVNSSVSKKISSLSEELTRITADTEMSDSQKQQKLDKINKEISDIQLSSNALSSSQSSPTSSLLSAMFGNSDEKSSSLSALNDAIFSSGSTLSNVKTLYNASRDIQNQARTLASEIAVDKARGADISDKQNRLSNLVGNVSIIDKKLKSTIDSALESPEKLDEETLSVIDGIKKSLEENEKIAQKQAQADIAKITGEAPKTESTDETEKTDSAETTKAE